MLLEARGGSKETSARSVVVRCSLAPALMVLPGRVDDPRIRQRLRDGEDLPLRTSGGALPGAYRPRRLSPEGQARRAAPLLKVEDPMNRVTFRVWNRRSAAPLGPGRLRRPSASDARKPSATARCERWRSECSFRDKRRNLRRPSLNMRPN